MNKNRKKLLILSAPIPPNHIGGDGKFAYDIAIALGNKNLEVIIFSPIYNGKESYKKKGNLTIIQVPIKDKLSKDGWDVPIWEPGFAEYRDKIFYEYLLKHNLINNNVWFHEIGGSIYNSLLKKITSQHNIKYSCHMQIVLANYDKQIKNNRYLKQYTLKSQRQLVKDSELTFFLSEYDAKPFKIDTLKYAIVPNGVDLSKRVEKNSRKEKKENFDIFIGGRLHDRMKGAKEIFTILNRNLKTNPNLILHICAPDRTHFDIFDKKLLKKIKFYGWKSTEETQKIIGKCDLAIVPSVYEPFGLIAIESLANSVPVLATKIGGLSEIIKPGINGEFINLKNPTQINKLIDRLILNPEYLDKYTHKYIKKSLAKYDIQNIADLYIKHLSKFINTN